jgi:hypothetical protein
LLPDNTTLLLAVRAVVVISVLPLGGTWPSGSSRSSAWSRSCSSSWPGWPGSPPSDWQPAAAAKLTAMDTIQADNSFRFIAILSLPGVRTECRRYSGDTLALAQLIL